MLEEKEYNKLHEILKMTRAGRVEAQIIEKFIQENIDSSCTICPHCSAQVKFGFKRITKWYEANKTSIEAREEKKEIKKRKTKKKPK